MLQTRHIPNWTSTVSICSEDKLSLIGTQLCERNETSRAAFRSANVLSCWHSLLTLVLLIYLAFANSVDPEKPTDLDLHCLLLSI